MPPHRWTPRLPQPRTVIVCVLLPLAIAGALVLSASATRDLAIDHQVPHQIAPAAVAMLEIVSLTGTLLWVLVANRTLRRDAVLATVAASGVSLVAGVHAYGWFGAVASLALVGTVHLASRAWRESWDAEPVSDPGQVEDAAAAGDDAPAAALPTVIHHGQPVDAALVASAHQVLVDDPLAGRPRLIEECGVTDALARKLLDALRPIRAVPAEAAS